MLSPSRETMTKGILRPSVSSTKLVAWADKKDFTICNNESELEQQNETIYSRHLVLRDDDDENFIARFRHVIFCWWLTAVRGRLPSGT